PELAGDGRGHADRQVQVIKLVADVRHPLGRWRVVLHVRRDALDGQVDSALLVHRLRFRVHLRLLRSLVSATAQSRMRPNAAGVNAQDLGGRRTRTSGCPDDGRWLAPSIEGKDSSASPGISGAAPLAPYVRGRHLLGRGRLAVCRGAAPLAPSAKRPETGG